MCNRTFVSKYDEKWWDYVEVLVENSQTLDIDDTFDRDLSKATISAKSELYKLKRVDNINAKWGIENVRC